MADTATKIPFAEAAAPSTPAANKVVVYAKSDGLMYSKDDAGVETLMSGGAGGGSVAADAIWDAAGDLAQGTGANTAAKLTLGAAGTVVRSTGSTNAYAFPPGHEFDYAQITSTVNVTATVEASAQTLITGAAVAYDGSTIVELEFYSPGVAPRATASTSLGLTLWDGSTDLGRLGWIVAAAAVSAFVPVLVKVRFTPSAATHTYSIRSWVSASSGTSNILAGSGTSGGYQPAFMRITKA